MCCSGSKCLFLSSEFPGSRLAAIPGTGVTFPPEPNEQKERGVPWGGGGTNMRAQLHMHMSMSHTCMLNVEMHSHSLTFSETVANN